MAKQTQRTYRSSSAGGAGGRSAAVRQTLPAAEEPMHHYPHTIPLSIPEAVRPSTAQAQFQTQVLEQLSCQSQLLVDILGAVNSLTAALLCRMGTEKS